MDIISLGSSQTADSGQWRISFSGLGREARLFVSSPDQDSPVSVEELDNTFDWISVDNNSPLELVFDLDRRRSKDLFSFEVEVFANLNLSWTLEALNSNSSWSIGSLEVSEGDRGPLLTFEADEDTWFFTAKAPLSTKRKSGSATSAASKQQTRKCRVLVDASPSARGKLGSDAVCKILGELDRQNFDDHGERLKVSYLGLKTLEISRDQQIDSQHRNALLDIAGRDERPDPLRKIVKTEAEEAPRGSRLVVISDGTFLVSAELEQIVLDRDLRIDLLVVGNPAVLPTFSKADQFSMRIVGESIGESELEEICAFSL